MTHHRDATVDGALAEEAAFRDWYDAMLPRVYAYLYNRCGRARDVAEELTQQTFVAAARQRSRFEGRSDTLTWVIGIARHKLVDHFRRSALDERRFERLAREWTGSAAPSSSSGARLSDEEMLERLAALPGQQRAALILAYVDELPVREVARVLGRSESATESLLTRARQNYRRLYGKSRR